MHNKYKWDLYSAPSEPINCGIPPKRRWNPDQCQKAVRQLEVFEKTRDRLISGEYRYDWHKAHICNAGLVARAALDLVFFEFWDLLAKNSPEGEIPHQLSWQYLAENEKERCLQTGLPKNVIFQALQDIGITLNSVALLENFGRATPSKDKSKSNFLAYLNRAIARLERLLQEQNELAVKDASLFTKAKTQVLASLSVRG